VRVVCILAYYNRPRLVRFAVASVLAQTHRDWRLVIVDDDSDEELLIPDELLDDTRVRMFRMEPSESPRGPGRLSSCVNYGLTMTELAVTGLASRDVAIVYLGDDDWYHHEWFARLSEGFETSPATDVVYGRLHYAARDDGATQVYHGMRTRFPMEFETPAQELDHNQVAHRGSCLVGWPLPIWTEDEVAISEKVRARTGDWSRGSDAAFFAELYERTGDWKPIDEPAAFKRLHRFAIIGSRPGEVGERRE
jgi:hypothetical protein